MPPPEALEGMNHQGLHKPGGYWKNGNRITYPKIKFLQDN